MDRAKQIKPQPKNTQTRNLEIKAGILDELLELLEDKYLGYLMSLTEKEKNAPLKEAEKLLR